MFALLLALQTTAAIPRIDAEVRIDGRLDEAAWQQAARLTGFRQYQPVDGRPAEERTEVLVWYSPRAIHFGIIAHARDPRTIRATVADRDAIDRDDRITIYLDTFDDRRRAFVFAVNPLGVQADGVHTEGAVSAGRLFGGTLDYSPDFHFESRGALTDSGYVVEVRIPFRSLRYPSGSPQRWGLQIVRNVPESGYEDTWTDVRRAGASFLAQSGRIEGLHDLERGVVTEVQPFVTASADGARPIAGGRFERGDPHFDAGANLRLGFTQFAIDATINPDFSQIESDAGLVTVNERFGLFVPEKRPFFLEGIELFATPGQLVHTRRIVDPLAGAKFTGKIGPWSMAYLAALDDEISGPDAVVNIARVRRDLGGSSVAALTATSREDRGAFNRVAAADARIVFEGLYYFEGQLGGSWTGADGAPDRTSPIWKLELDRTGRSWGFNYQVNGIGDDFAAALGFVPRSGIASAHVFNRFSWYGERGAMLESVTMFFGPRYLWRHDGFARERAIEGGEEVTAFARFRGGWVLTGNLSRQFVEFEPAAYEGYTADRGGSFEPYTPPSRISDLFTPALTLETPTWQRANATLSLARGAVPIFTEGSEGRITQATAALELRPLTVVRVEGSAILTRIDRERDGSEFARVLIPRAKVEYQPVRSLFFRGVGEYQSQRVDALRDARTGDPLLIGGHYASGGQVGALRAEWLISYQPTPGTVAFAGYASAHQSPHADRWSGFERALDGFFVKLAYQFRR
ncbi:MAG TPA: DUF5916 domain-containing protein [Gemmatimonadaceae bacterium]|nr:DUF5916 domain-containing protein [Gemmatimonadaceae bacterium]